MIGLAFANLASDLGRLATHRNGCGLLSLLRDVVFDRFDRVAFRTKSERLVFLPGVLRRQRSEEALALVVWTCREEQDISGPGRSAVAEPETP
jgi:hypothetical protein